MSLRRRLAANQFLEQVLGELLGTPLGAHEVQACLDRAGQPDGVHPLPERAHAGTVGRRLGRESSGVVRPHGFKPRRASIALLAAYHDCLSPRGILLGHRYRSDRRLCGGEIREANVAQGSVAPVRGRRMQSFGSELVPIVGRHARTTAAAIISFLRGASEGHVPRWTSHSPRKPLLAAMGWVSVLAWHLWLAAMRPISCCRGGHGCIHSSGMIRRRN